MPTRGATGSGSFGGAFTPSFSVAGTAANVPFVGVVLWYNAQVPTITIGGEAATLHGSPQTGGPDGARAQFFWHPGLASGGSVTVAFDFGASTFGFAVVAQYADAAPAGPIDATAGAVAASGSTASCTLTSTVGSTSLLAAESNTAGDPSAYAPGDATTIVDLDTFWSDGAFGVDDLGAAGGHTISATLSGSAVWLIAAAAIKGVAVSGFDLDPTGPVALTGRAGVTGDVDVSTGFVVAPTPVAIAARLAVTGNIGFRRTWEFEPPLALPQMGGALRITGDLEFGKTFDLGATTALALHAALGAAGDVATQSGGPFDLAAGTLALQGRATVTGDIRAGSPFDIAAGAITLRGSLTAAGDITSSDAPPTPPPAPAEDPLSAKFLARRKRPNIRMRWGSDEEPEPLAPEPTPAEPAPEPPRLARGLDLELLPEPPASAAPAPGAPAAPLVAPTAPAALPTAPVAPVAPPVVPPPDLTAEVAALRAAHASLQQEMQQAAAQAVQRAADIYMALQQQTAHLERELAQARSEIAALRAKVERDARNRRRAEEITHKLLGNK